MTTTLLIDWVRWSVKRIAVAAIGYFLVGYGLMWSLDLTSVESDRIVKTLSASWSACLILAALAVLLCVRGGMTTTISLFLFANFAFGRIVVGPANLVLMLGFAIIVFIDLATVHGSPLRGK